MSSASCQVVTSLLTLLRYCSLRTLAFQQTIGLEWIVGFVSPCELNTVCCIKSRGQSVDAYLYFKRLECVSMEESCQQILGKGPRAPVLQGHCIEWKNGPC